MKPDYNIGDQLPIKFVEGEMDPKTFFLPDLFTKVGDALYHKFDEIYLFYAEAAGSMVVAFYLRGKQVYWQPVNIPGFRGELRLSELLGWQKVIPT